MASILLAVVLLALAATATATTVDLTDPSNATAQQPPEPHQKELLAEILDSLGLKELARGVDSLYQFVPYPVTVFAPTDDLHRRSRDDSIFLSNAYLAHGLYTAARLARLDNGSMIDLQGGSGLFVSSTTAAAGSKIFVDGIEITRPDLFNDGRIAVHGIRSFTHPFYRNTYSYDPRCKMLHDAISVLQLHGYKMLAAEVDGLKRALLYNMSYMTVFGLDDQSILADGGERYMNDFPFYIVPNHRLTRADLVRLPKRIVLPTLDVGQRLVVTRSGAAGKELLQINGISIKAPDVFCNAKIAVHGITEPFSADYHQGFRLFSLDDFVKVIFAVLVVLLSKLLVHIVAHALERHGWGPHPRQD